jgi:hypothetical protein
MTIVCSHVTGRKCPDDGKPFFHNLAAISELLTSLWSAGQPGEVAPSPGPVYYPAANASFAKLLVASIESNDTARTVIVLTTITPVRHGLSVGRQSCHSDLFQDPRFAESRRSVSQSTFEEKVHVRY